MSDLEMADHCNHGEGPAGADRRHDVFDPFQDGRRFVFESDQVPAPERAETARAGDVVFGSGYVTAANVLLGRTTNPCAGQASADQENEGIFWIYLKGGAAVRLGSVEGLRETGSAWFMHADVPSEGLTYGAHVLAINLPGKSLPSAVGHNNHLKPVALSSADPIIPLVKCYIEAAMNLPAASDPVLMTSVGKHLTELIAQALGPTRDAAEQVKQGGLKSARLQAVLREIEENYADPEFCVTDVAMKLNLSVRYVQDILHETGTGFTERVLELRLRQAQSLLCCAHAAMRKVSDIAFSCGFNNLSYFHRAFRRRFGVTPAGARAV